MKVIDPELLKFSELLSLQQLAASKVAILVCVSQNVQFVIRNFTKTKCNEGSIGYWTNCGMIGNTGFSDDQWKLLCDAVRIELNPIRIPKIIIDIILEKMWPVCYEIFKWILHHDADTGIDYTSKLYWTVCSNINYEETAKILIADGTVNILKRFKLASFYCLEPEIRSLWDLMDLSDKRSFFIRGNLKKSNVNPIILYWTYYIQEIPLDKWESKKLNPTELFKYAAQNGYFYATKYFFGKLKKQVRNRMIHKCFVTHFLVLLRNHNVVKDSHYAIAYFLISEMRDDILKRMEHFFMFSLVFRYFLEWPFQKHFMTVIDSWKQRLNSDMYIELLEAIFEKDHGCFKDYDYKKLFKEFWFQIPEITKSYIGNRSVGCRMFLRFVIRHFGFVFEEKSFAQKSRFRAIVLQGKTSSENISFEERENVEFFKFFIREGIVSKSVIHRLPRAPGGEFSWKELGASPPEESVDVPRIERNAFPPNFFDDIPEDELDDIPWDEFDDISDTFPSRGIFTFNAPSGELIYLVDSILGNT